jgi:2'-5' RNA ligase
MLVRRSSVGTLRYSVLDDWSYRLIVEVDPGIVALARALMPKWIHTNPQRYEPHITVIRNEAVSNTGLWAVHEGHEIEFEYDPHVQDDGRHLWLYAFSPRLHEIRVELGLKPLSELSRPPDSAYCFHVTIGNTRGIVPWSKV